MKYVFLILSLFGVILMQGWTLYYSSQIRSDLFVRPAVCDSSIGQFELCLNKHNRKIAR
jgi:hypothetical protein